jgi:hypothetical protein
MVAATMDTLPFSNPLKKHRYPQEYTIAATGSKMTTQIGILRNIGNTNNSKRIDTKPANWDQKKDLKGPICLE